MRLKADLTLLLVAVIWGSAFIAQRLAALSTGVFLFNGMRFLLGGVVLLPVIAWQSARKHQTPLTNNGSTRQLTGVAMAGLLLFTAGGFQQAGLRTTTAGNAAFITGLYVVFVPLILRVFWKQRLYWAAWLAAVLAAGGILLLSTGGQLRLSPGDSLELVGAVFWALHVIWVGKMVQHMDALQFSAGQFAVAGVLNLAAGAWLEREAVTALPAAWFAIAYTGVLSIGAGYTLQAVGQRHAPPSEAAILLSTEAVFAVIFGYFFLEEMLSPLQLLGCGLILLAILFAQLRPNLEETPIA